ncbi:unnamed protein product, partial [Gulo gulo]
GETAGPPAARGSPRGLCRSGPLDPRKLEIPEFREATALPPREPLRSCSHGSALPYGRGPQQGPQSDQEREQAEAQPPARAPHQAHQVRAGHDPRGVRLRPLRAARHGAAQGVQGQARPQVHQEKGGDAHPCQEEARGAEQCPRCHEESGGQEGLSPPPVCNKAFLELRVSCWSEEGGGVLARRTGEGQALE